MVIWQNSNGRGNAWVSDGQEGYWATVPANWTARMALDEYIRTADYGECDSPFTIVCEKFAEPRDSSAPWIGDAESRCERVIGGGK